MSGQIYFPVYDPNPDRRTYDIHVMDLVSGERRIMLGQASQPALSPNGGRLAYRSWDIDRRGIRVRELSDENTWEWVGFHEAEHASWSPDNLSLVFSSQQESDRKWRLYRTRGVVIERVEREGGDIYGRVPTWSIDGRIIYWECPMGSCGLHAIHPDGTGLVRLTGNEYDTAPAVSPDGSQIAFMSNRDGNWEIYVVDAYRAGPDLEEPSRLTTNGSHDGLPAWSPSGQWIAFASDRGGTWAIWAMRTDGSGKQKLFELGGPLMGEVANVPPAEQHGWTWETLAWGE
jgi:Tol biopolymer transport system component